MAHFADHSQQNHLFLLALLCSIALHGAAVAFLPGFSTDTPLHDTEFTVDLLKPEPPPPPPPPVKEPEPPKPEPQKTKVVPPSKPLPVPAPKPVTPPPQPIIQPTVSAPPPPVAEPPPQIIAVPQKAAEPTPSVTIPAPPAPPPPLPQEPVVDDASAAKAGYGRLLAGEFAKHKKYPQVARMRGWQGTAQIRLQVDADGNALNPVVEQSSGKEILDNQALETVRNSLPLPPPPAILRGKPFSIVVPVVFRLESPS